MWFPHLLLMLGLVLAGTFFSDSVGSMWIAAALGVAILVVKISIERALPFDFSLPTGKVAQVIIGAASVFTILLGMSYFDISDRYLLSLLGGHFAALFAGYVLIAYIEGEPNERTR